MSWRSLAGGPVFHLAVGHATFLPYFYLPWILFLFISAIRTRALRYAAGAGAGLALTIYSGGLHMAFMAAIALVCFSVAAAAFRREWHPLVVLGAVGVFSALLAAPKLVPTLVFLRDPRLADSRSFVPGGDTMNLNVLEHSLLDLYQYRRLRVNGDCGRDDSRIRPGFSDAQSDHGGPRNRAVL